MRINRRTLLAGTIGAGLAPAAALARPTAASVKARAAAVIEANRARTDIRDRIALVDFSRPSWAKRYHVVDFRRDVVRSFYVAHGRGSDPAHSGWLESFSNAVGSKATSAGAYRVLGEYHGKYGRALRLEGLDPENSNAERRAIVLHAAWYAEPAVLREQGKMGRSEGCFAFSEADRNAVLDLLRPGALIVAGKFS